MGYELAKKLKEAGFKRASAWFMSPDDEVLPGPTLEELIEACGKPLRLQNSEPFLWQADTCGDFENNWDEKKHIRANGQTPSEAVANLWLELNKK